MDTRSSAARTPTARRRDPEEIVALYRDRLGAAVTAASVAHGRAYVEVAPEALPQAAEVAKRDPALDMDFFDMMAGIDAGEDGFAVVTRLYSTRLGHDVILRGLAPGGREAPRLPTLTTVYRGANWHEREAYDMYGIVFDGHPGLEPRLLTVENFEGWPLRKDFLLTTREIKPWPGEKVPKPAETPAAKDTPAEEDAEDKARRAREKAERAKRKAAEIRAKKAAERAAAQAEAEEER